MGILDTELKLCWRAVHRTLCKSIKAHADASALFLGLFFLPVRGAKGSNWCAAARSCTGPAEICGGGSELLRLRCKAGHVGRAARSASGRRAQKAVREGSVEKACIEGGARGPLRLEAACPGDREDLLEELGVIHCAQCARGRCPNLQVAPATWLSHCCVLAWAPAPGSPAPKTTCLPNLLA
jgi:hypothetical protein